MKIIRYSQWRETNIALHMIVQMMGKVKLRKMAPQPEWNHSLLDLTADGFTTGLVPDGGYSFEIRVSLCEKKVTARCTSGLQAGFALRDDTSVREYYHKFTAMLDHIRHGTDINRVPQEVFFTTPFDEQTSKVDFDGDAAEAYFANCVFARNALLSFTAPFRGKKIQPSLFWGTLDLTAVLFSGKEKPFPGEGLIERVAFDEQFVEFGFWPGDEKSDEPCFFVLPYPFLTREMDSGKVSPKEAFYSADKMEYFLKLEDALQYDEPGKVVEQFCRDAFEAIIKEEQWDNTEWFQKPLLI